MGTVVAATGWRIKFIHRWRKVIQALNDKGVDGIEKKYGKKDRLTASVELSAINYDPVTNRAKPYLDIDAGPKVSIRALEAKVSKGKLRAYVPVYEEGSVDNDLLAEGALTCAIIFNRAVIRTPTSPSSVSRYRTIRRLLIITSQPGRGENWRM